MINFIAFLNVGVSLKIRPNTLKTSSIHSCLEATELNHFFLYMDKCKCAFDDLTPTDKITKYLASSYTFQNYHRTITYAYFNYTQDLPPENLKTAIDNAMISWSNVIMTDFAEVQYNQGPMMVIYWSSVDGVSGTLAFATLPTVDIDFSAIDNFIVFDEDEAWGASDSGSQRDLETVALHELGHILGLFHSSSSSAVMYAYYLGERRTLTSDDSTGILTLYRKRTNVTALITAHIQDVGDRGFKENEFAGTRSLSRRMEGFIIDPIYPSDVNLTLKYSAVLDGTGDTGTITEGSLCGTRGESREIHEVKLWLEGSDSSNYSVYYMAHVEDNGDTSWFTDNQSCPSSGSTKRIEGLTINIEAD